VVGASSSSVLRLTWTARGGDVQERTTRGKRKNNGRTSTDRPTTSVTYTRLTGQQYAPRQRQRCICKPRHIVEFYGPLSIYRRPTKHLAVIYRLYTSELPDQHRQTTCWTVQLMPDSHHPPDTTRRSCLCRVWCTGVYCTIALNVFRLQIFCRQQP